MLRVLCLTSPYSLENSHLSARVTIDTDLFKPTKRKKQSGCEPHSDGCQEAILQPTKKPRRKPNVDEDEDGDSVSDEMPVAGPSRKTDKSGQFKSASKGKGREKRNGISEANEKEDVNDDEEMELSREGDGTGRGVTRGVDQDGDGDASLDQSEADELADESFRTESSGIVSFLTFRNIVAVQLSILNFLMFFPFRKP